MVEMLRPTAGILVVGILAGFIALLNGPMSTDARDVPWRKATIQVVEVPLVPPSKLIEIVPSSGAILNHVSWATGTQPFPMGLPHGRLRLGSRQTFVSRPPAGEDAEQRDLARSYHRRDKEEDGL